MSLQNHHVFSRNHVVVSGDHDVVSANLSVVSHYFGEASVSFTGHLLNK
jgi:hypothetical protein